MTEIRELDPETVERIAAGEVVERPASVVKELVENSLDADATRVEVAVEAGGTGMTEDELRRAVEEHTTSKITDIGDLEGGVGTLGFRGEALHAIGAVSRLTITTRPHAEKHPGGGSGNEHGSGDTGTELTVEGGEVTGVEPAGCPEGTTVEVRDLFYNVPARRKYLKQESTEFAHVNRVVTGYALANPDVAVSLAHDGRETFAAPGRGDRRETVMAVFSGLVSHPETNRASRDYLSTFVNGRYVTAGAVRDAVVDAYGTQLAPDRYPFAILDLSVDPATVDVNVHPRKLEVRFADEAGVREQVLAAVEEALLFEGLVRSSAPRGQSAPEQTEIQPGEDAGAGEDSDSGRDTGSRDGAGSGGSAGTTAETGADGIERDGREEGPVASAVEETSAGPEVGETTPASAGSEHRSATDGPHMSADRRHESPTEERKFDGPQRQERLGEGERGEPREFDSLPAMRVLGQFHETYVVAETADGLVLIDQHAADERVNYERLRGSFAGDIGTQALAEPVELALTAGEVDAFERHVDALARLGFRAGRVDDRTVAVRTVPTLIAEAADPELLRDVLAAFVADESVPGETVEAAADELLADLACYPSVTGNTSLTEGSVLDLLAALDDCENPYACPHGRPVMIELDREELDARFERDYPGHR
ncbi:MAG: DNA mismatch repair protein MutL [Halobacteriales archaeon SW_9_67_25]|nr:MAG: DNA mismatch repair protein MutL [Halobacteriales archaeon SW_9_67_25]